MKFSILIPTRNRPNTIQSTIESVLENKKYYNDFEIIVSDNSDTPGTLQKIQDRFGEQVSIIPQSGKLSMSENWEAALSCARGEYIIVIGDDDGLLPTTLSTLKHIIDYTDAQVISWPWIHYAWPNTLAVEHGCDMYLPTASSTYTMKQARPILQRLAACESCNYSELPCLYNSVVHRDVIELIKSKLGRLFIGKSPDITSGVLIAYACEEWIRLNSPLSIAGMSPTSNGSAHLQRINASSKVIIADFKRLNTGKLINIEWIPNSNTIYDAIVEDLVRCHLSFFPNDVKLKINRRKLLQRCFDGFIADTPSEFQANYEKILSSAKDDPKLLRWFSKKYSKYTLASRQSNRVHEWWSNPPGLTSTSLTINAKRVNVNNVFECARYAGILYGTITNRSTFVWNEMKNPVNPNRLSSLIAKLRTKIFTRPKNFLNPVAHLLFSSLHSVNKSTSWPRLQISSE